MHEVQTRNEAGATPVYETIDAAFKAAEEDVTIWKISWTDATTNERVRFIRVRLIGISSEQIYWRYDPIVIPTKRSETV